MNKDFWERVDWMEKLAGKATQGEWYPEYPQGCDIEFIAAANPAMIKEMVAELRQMELDIRGLKHDKQILEEATEKSAKDNLELRSSLNQLEKEADWLAEKVRKCSFAYRNRSCHHLCVGNCSICLYDNRIATAQDFREAARKAVSEADNAVV